MSESTKNGNGAPHVELRRVTKRYGTVTAISDLSLTVEKGSFTALLGPSGCGKSTLLRMIAGLEEITAGQCFIDSVDVTDVPPAQRRIAMVFQSYALYPHMTVRQNIAFSLSVAGAPRKVQDERALEVARILQLEAYLDRRPAELSGGQRQRVAIGRALVRKPEVFLFDEPLSNLDAKLRVQMRLELAKLHADLRTTMIYVTHDQTEAMTLGQRVTVMDHGVVQQTDAPKKLYDWPTNTFVASFIGSPPMNFVRGTLDSGRVDLGGIVVALPEGRLNQLSAERREMTAGLRPESFVAADGDSTDRSTIRGQVEVVEQLGSESFVYFRTEGLEVLEIGDRPVELRGALCSKLPASIEYEPGDRIDLSVRAELLRLFEPDSGQAILSK
jgi:ABC-type sugar transport system ATPase subunit